MKIDYISDLHLDFYKDISIESLCSNGDILLIGGDISNNNEQTEHALSVFCSIYPNVVTVIGNHDLYGDTFARLLGLKEICKKYGITLLDNTTTTIGDVTIGGGSGWCDFSYSNDPLSVYRYKRQINDMRFIDREYFNNDVYMFALEQKKKIKDLSIKCDILLTHFGGRRRSIAPQYKNENSTDFFYFNGEDIEVPWVYGHQHTAYEDKNTFVNPMGYPFENNTAKIKSISC